MKVSGIVWRMREKCVLYSDISVLFLGYLVSSRIVLGRWFVQGGLSLLTFSSLIVLRKEIAEEILSDRGRVAFGFCLKTEENLELKIYLCVGCPVYGYNLEAYPMANFNLRNKSGGCPDSEQRLRIGLVRKAPVAIRIPAWWTESNLAST